MSGAYPCCTHCGAAELGSHGNPCGFRDCPGSVASRFARVTAGQWITLALAVVVLAASVVVMVVTPGGVL